MAKTLVIVESPAKAKTINKYLGNDYIVKASFGHVRDLPSKDMGVDLENDFAPTYEINEDKEKIVKELVKLAKECDTVLLASDPDREGEAIAWHLNELLKRHCKNIHRIFFNEITKTAILKAVQGPQAVDLDMVNSQQARRILDRIVGYQLSPWLNRTIGARSAGRVQSVALRVIVDREREIENFKPEEYWKVFAKLTPLTENFPFNAELVKKGNDVLKIKNKDIVDEILHDLEDVEYVVKSVEKKERAKKPAAPFTTSTLQQESVRKLKWDSSKAMRVAQNLYEGVDLGDGSHGLITYMRTDSTRISDDFQRETLGFIKDTYGEQYRPKSPNIYKSKGDAQDAHEAVRPTDVTRTPESIKQYLNADQYELYKLIWERYVASQMSPALFDTMTVLVNADDYEFKAAGSSLKFDGFQVLYTEDKDVEENAEKEEEGDIKLPQLKDREKLDLVSIDKKQKFTNPPSRFTEATLIQTLEAKGVGRPSTYASIISTIQNRGYVTVSKTRFDATQLGKLVVDTLVHSFPVVMDVQFTAGMEEDLDIVANGKKFWVDVLWDFYEPFTEALEKAKTEVKAIVKEEEFTGEDCPKCGNPLVIKNSKNGKFIACSGYPECDFSKPFIDEKFKTNHKCDKCDSYMIIRERQEGRKKQKYLACSAYPECKNTQKMDKKGNPVPKAQDSGKSCPKCDSPLLIREGKTGKFLACSGYPECTHSEPHIDESTKTIECDKCQSPMIFRKGQYGHYYGCSNYPTCKNNKKADAKGKVIDTPKPEETDKKCPKCGKNLVLRNGKNGKFYSCPGYPQCSHAEPYIDPNAEKKDCDKCGKPMIKRKGTKGDFWGCSGYPDCKNIVNA